MLFTIWGQKKLIYNAKSHHHICIFVRKMLKFTHWFIEGSQNMHVHAHTLSLCCSHKHKAPTHTHRQTSLTRSVSLPLPRVAIVWFFPFFFFFSFVFFVFVEIIAAIFKTVAMATQRLMRVDRICCRATERLKMGDKRWEEM